MRVRASSLTSTVATACVVLGATGLMTNFFAPSEIDKVLHAFWALPVITRTLFVAGLTSWPILVIQGGRLLWHTVKGLIGWDFPADRSAWFVISRLVAFTLLAGGVVILAGYLIDVGRHLVV